MNSQQIREAFLDYFKEKDHTIVPSSSLLPDDPSVLLTTAGMQQFKQYYSELDPETTIHPSIRNPVGKNATSSQKCFRTSDIDEVGDESHLTFFEMLGNFSFGGYFKEEAIRFAHEFITSQDWMGLELDYVTYFDPNEVPDDDWRKEGVPRDDESKRLWLELGVPEDKIRPEGIDVFWGPTGNEGPCGPTTELYVKNALGQSIEVWNIVFNQYYCDKERKLTKLKTPGVDTGMGLERLVMVKQHTDTIFDTDLFREPFGELFSQVDEKSGRVMADHLRGATFLLADGVRPSNKEAGYILRRLMRRALVHARKHDIDTGALLGYVRDIIKHYGGFYNELVENEDVIIDEFSNEFEKFDRSLAQGLRELEKEVAKHEDLEDVDKIAEIAFHLYQSYGLPVDIAVEQFRERDINFNREKMRAAFDVIFEKHQEVSRAGQEQKFGGHGLILDTGELKAGSEEDLKKVTRLHTATHLMQQALRQVLGESVEQRGSDITPDRTRFDFTFDRKMTDEEKAEVERIVNDIIKNDLPVACVEMPYDEAKKTGALHFFKQKYPEMVKVYYVGNELESAFSKEFCGGPHVERTGEIGTFRILKEKSSSAGVRRIRATVE